MAITDALTGLYNRRYMETPSVGAGRAGGRARQAAAVLMLDIDYFKSINDSLRPRCRRRRAARIRRCASSKSIRGIDLACRYGGEEFVIVMPDTDMAVAALVAERIRRRIAGEPFAIEQGAKAIDVTISIGLAALDRPDDTAAAMLKRADQALYRAKRDGRNRVVADAA